MNDLERRSLTLQLCGLELRAAAKEPPTLVGHPIVCGSMSDPINGQFREIVHPDAIRSAMSRQPDVRGLIDHDPSRILGRTRAGTMTLTQDARGLLMQCKLPNTSYAADLAESVRRGDVSGMSFGFTNRKDAWQDQVIDGQRTSVRTLHDLDLHDVSVVTYPAYPDPSVALRSLQRHQQGAKTREQKILEEIEARIKGHAPEQRRLKQGSGDHMSRMAHEHSARAHEQSAKAADAAGHLAAHELHQRAGQAHQDAANHLEELAQYHRSMAEGHRAHADMHQVRAKG